jgi:hypothetical protein
VEKRNAFMRLWFELEEFINDEIAVRDKVKNYFLGIYVHVRKRSSRSTSFTNAMSNAVAQGSLVAS